MSKFPTMSTIDSLIFPLILFTFYHVAFVKIYPPICPPVPNFYFKMITLQIISYNFSQNFSLHATTHHPRFSSFFFRFCKFYLQKFPYLFTTEYLIFTPKYSFCPLQTTLSFTTKTFLLVQYHLFSTPKCSLSPLNITSAFP